MKRLAVLAILTALLLPQTSKASIPRIQFGADFVFEDYSMTLDPFPLVTIERIEGVLELDLSTPVSLTEPRYYPGAVRELSVTLYDGLDNVLGMGSAFGGTAAVFQAAPGVPGSQDSLEFAGFPFFEPGIGNPSPLEGLGEELNGIFLGFDGAPGTLSSGALADVALAQIRDMLVSGFSERVILLAIDVEAPGFEFDQPIAGLVIRVAVPLPVGLPLLLAALGAMAVCSRSSRKDTIA